MKTKISWMLLGNIAYASSQFLVISAISKFLGTKDVGVFTFALAIVTPIMIFSNFGFRTVLITDSENAIDLNHVLPIRLYASMLGALLCILFSTTQGDILISLAVFAVSISKIVENLVDINYAIFHKEMTQEKIAKSLIGRSVTGVLFVFVTCIITNNIVIVLFAYSFSWLLYYLVFDSRLISNKTFQSVNIKTSREILLLGMPIAIYQLLTNFNMNIPRYFIESINGLELLGIYASLYFLVTSGTILVSSVGQVSLPKLSCFLKENDIRKHIKHVFVYSMFVVFISAILSFIFYYWGFEILNLLFNEQIASFSWLMTTMFALAAPQYLCNYFGFVLQSLKKNSSLLSVQFCMTTLLLSILFFLGDEVTLENAIYTYSFCSAVVFTAYLIYYVRLTRELIDEKNI